MANPSKRPDETARSGGAGTGKPAPRKWASGGLRPPARATGAGEHRRVEADGGLLQFLPGHGDAGRGDPGLAVNSQPFEVSTQPIAVTQRIILSPMTAKQ